MPAQIKISKHFRAAVLFLFILLMSGAMCYAVDYTLTWERPLEWDVAGYKVYYKAYVDTGTVRPPYDGTSSDSDYNSPVVLYTVPPYDGTAGSGKVCDSDHPYYSLCISDAANTFYVESDELNPVFTVKDLDGSKAYLFAVTAYNSRNQESDYY